jgi:hypothetical protein
LENDFSIEMLVGPGEQDPG